MIIKIKDREAISLGNFDTLKLIEEQIGNELANTIIATRYYTDNNGEVKELMVKIIECLLLRL
ncbi:MAG: hypothetical protein K0R34_2278 [Herbinix sp.]|jgi:hypothetical protein|nr:hypothetical protein [Herbinix sp.]